MIEVRHIRGEPKWMTLPFTDYCPPLVSAPQQEAALAFALQLESKAAGIRRVEVRAPLTGATPTCTAFRHVITLQDDADRIYTRLRRGAATDPAGRAKGSDDPPGRRAEDCPLTGPIGFESGAELQ